MSSRGKKEGNDLDAKSEMSRGFCGAHHRSSEVPSYRSCVIKGDGGLEGWRRGDGHVFVRGREGNGR